MPLCHPNPSLPSKKLKFSADFAKKPNPLRSIGALREMEE
jgi:hypothetical protein